MKSAEGEEGQDVSAAPLTLETDLQYTIESLKSESGPIPRRNNSMASIAASTDTGRTSSRRVNRRMSGTGSTTSSAATRLRVYKSNSTSKWVTREIAALEFLMGVPLGSERDIVHQGWMQQQGIIQDHDKSTKDEETKVEILEPPTQDGAQVDTQGPSSVPGRWWEKWVNHPSQHGSTKHEISNSTRNGGGELEQPPDLGDTPTAQKDTPSIHRERKDPVTVPVAQAPGRRLEGDDAVRVQVPLTVDRSLVTRQRSIARMAATREWELNVAHGIGAQSSSNRPAKAQPPANKQTRPPLLDGRLFLSASESYPVHVFSLLRYEPKKEEAARRRKKLEARGGGGTQFFIIPSRDWRGISYRALLPPKKQSVWRKMDENVSIKFDRFNSTSSEDLDAGRPDGISPVSGKQDSERSDLLHGPGDEDYTDDSEDEDTYVTGLLDDPEMVQGRHRNVMVGDRGSGPIVSSTIQFVKPKLLKADLNKQFRDRFDGWEPPKSQRQYIGARVVDGVYTLSDPGAGGDDGTIGTAEEDSHQPTITTTGTTATATTGRKRQGSISSMSTGGDGKELIRMPPSLTLSKIRSVKQQALLAAVNAKLEISTVALAIVYFERLCLDCRVDKTNRRLSFAACLLLALKMNEAHVELVMAKTEGDNAKKTNKLQSLIRPAKRSGNVFASLLEFFTQNWSISIKHLFAAEWGVFAALQFRLHAKPSQVAFHYKRLLKSLDWNPRSYLGSEMFGYWQDELSREDYLRVEREQRREARQQRKERKKLLQLQRELGSSRNESPNNAIRLEHGQGFTTGETPEAGQPNSIFDYSPVPSPPKAASHLRSGVRGLLTRFHGSKGGLSGDPPSNERQRDTNVSIRQAPPLPVLSHGELIGDHVVIDIAHTGDGEEFSFDSNRSEVGSDTDDGGIII